MALGEILRMRLRESAPSWSFGSSKGAWALSLLLPPQRLSFESQPLRTNNPQLNSQRSEDQESFSLPWLVSAFNIFQHYFSDTFLKLNMFQPYCTWGSKRCLKAGNGGPWTTSRAGEARKSGVAESSEMEVPPE